MSGSRFDEENFYGIGFNDPYDRFSDQIQKNHHESFADRKKADEMVFLREKQRKNRFLNNDISAKNVRKVKRVSKPKVCMQKFKYIVTAVVVASAIVAGANAFNNNFSSPSFDETSPGKVYNDPNGYEVFENEVEFMKYCNDNDINISDTEGYIDSSGKVYISSSSLSNAGVVVSDSGNFIEVSKGEVYNDGYKKFDNEVSLREYCEDNGIDISQVRGFSSSDGAVYVSSVSLDNTIDSGYSR